MNLNDQKKKSENKKALQEKLSKKLAKKNAISQVPEE